MLSTEISVLQVLKTFYLLSYIIINTSATHDHISIHGLAQIHDLAYKLTSHLIT